MVASAIPADLLAEEGIRSLAGVHLLPAPRETVRHPDWRKGNRFGRRPPVSGSGIYFPIHSPSAEQATYQFKPDVPRVREKKDGSHEIVKYETPPGTRLAIYAPRRVRRWLRSRARKLWITEGAKKVLAGAAAGLCIIGLMGVDGWVVKSDPTLPSDPLPDWDEIELSGRIVFIAFDSDVMTKDAVKAALRRLSEFLVSRGATVVPVYIPSGPKGEKQGLDDYIAARVAAGVSHEDAVAELETSALLAALNSPVVGFDGEQTCQDCVDRGKAVRLIDQLRKHGPFRPNHVAVILDFLDTAVRLRRTGRTRMTLNCGETANRTNVGTFETSRAVRAYIEQQDGRELGADLPFRLHRWQDAKKRNRVDLEVAVGTGDPLTVAGACLTMSRWTQKPSTEAGDRPRDARPRSLCDGCGGILFAYQKVCRSCGKVHTYTIPYISARRAGAEAPTAAGPLAQNASGPPASSPLTTCESPKWSDPIPISFVTSDDILLARGPHHRPVPDDEMSPSDPGPDPPRPQPTIPGWQPPALAPRDHIARGLRRRAPPADPSGPQGEP